jgi:hypothetical protein
MGAYFTQMKSFTSAWGGRYTRPRHITLLLPIRLFRYAQVFSAILFYPTVIHFLGNISLPLFQLCNYSRSGLPYNHYLAQLAE